MFPSDRLARAGATPDELAQLEAEHEARTPAEQEGWLSKLESLAHGDLVQWLVDLRKAGAFVIAEAEEIVDKAEHKPATEPQDEPAEPEKPKPDK